MAGEQGERSAAQAAAAGTMVPVPDRAPRVAPVGTSSAGGEEVRTARVTGIIPDNFRAYQLKRFPLLPKDPAEKQKAEEEDNADRASITSTTTKPNGAPRNVHVIVREAPEGSKDDQVQMYTMGAHIPPSHRHRRENAHPVDAPQDGERIQVPLFRRADATEVDPQTVADKLHKPGWKWRAITGKELSTQHPEGEEPKSPPRGGWAVDKAITDHYTGPFAVAQEQVRVPPEAVHKRAQEIVAKTESDLKQAQSEGHLIAARTTSRGVQRIHDSLKQSASRKVRRNIITLVGAPDEASLEDVVTLVAGAVDRIEHHEVQVSPESYNTEQEALAAARIANEASVGFGEKAIDVWTPKPPDHEVHGLKLKRRTVYAENVGGEEDIPADRLVSPARIITNTGRLGRPLPMDADRLREGGLFLGINGMGKTFAEMALAVEFARTTGNVFMITSKAPKEGAPHPAQILANAAAEHDVDVSLIRVGHDRVGGNIMEPRGAKWERYMPVVFALLSRSFGFGEKNGDNLALETIMRYIEEGWMGDQRKLHKLEGLFRKYGINPINGQALEPGSDPTIGLALATVDGVLMAADAKEYAPGTDTSNVRSWSESVATKKVSGKLRQLLLAPPLDQGKMLQPGENGRRKIIFADASALEQYAYALWYGEQLARFQEFYINNQGQKGMFIGGEANVLFHDDVLTQYINTLAAQGRESGVSLVLDAQTLNLDPETTANLRHRFFFGNIDFNLKQIKEKTSGILTEDMLEDMETMERQKAIYIGYDRPVLVKINDMSRYIDPPEGDVPLIPATELVVDGTNDFDFNMDTAVALDEEFLTSPACQALRAFVDATADFMITGLCKQPASKDENFFALFQKYGADQTDPNIGPRLDRLAFHIKNAVFPAAVERQKDFLKLRRKGISMKEVMAELTRRVYHAGNHGEPDYFPDEKYVVPGYEGVQAEAEIIHYLNENTSSVLELSGAALDAFHNTLPPYDQERLHYLLGRDVAGDTPLAQLDNLGNPPTKDTFFTNDPYTSGTILEASIGMSMDDAVKNGEINDWLRKFKQVYIRGIDAPEPATEYFFNIAYTEIHRRDRLYRRKNPQAATAAAHGGSPTELKQGVEELLVAQTQVIKDLGEQVMTTSHLLRRVLTEDEIQVYDEADQSQQGQN